MARTAIVLFNLGGPDRPEAVRPFLFNLFNDPSIIAMPPPLRWLLARLISARRAPLARAIYEKIGGASPLLANTAAQGAALEAALGPDHRCFPAMRYWHPRAAAALSDIVAWRPDRVVLLPLYPQYSTTTTGSSLAEWQAEAARAGLSVPTAAICCSPREPGFISAMAALLRETLRTIPSGVPVRILFSAHGLPKRIVAAGDPYRWQVEATVAALRAALAMPGLDSVICYQSRVGPLEWIGPATDAEIRRAAAAGLGIVVVPVAFVSEHSETLVELDIEYRHLADAGGAAGYWRVPAVGTHPDFIAGLAGTVRQAIARGEALAASEGARLCPLSCGRCPMTTALESAA